MSHFYEQVKCGKTYECLSLYRHFWIYGMELWSDLDLYLIAFKSHKCLFFQRGFHALYLITQAV